jgi:aspartate/methionine/tyrosine aminotransferase
VLYLNSPNNPFGRRPDREDIEKLAQLARDRNLWVVSDEAYEDVVYKGEHVSIASLPGMYDRTIPVYTLSKSYAITGVRVGYFAIKDQALRDRALKIIPLHDQQRLVDRAVRRARGHGRLAAVHRRLQERAADSARHVLQGPRRSGARVCFRARRPTARSTPS